jgi:2-dehydro-3-deoxygluconokinase
MRSDMSLDVITFGEAMVLLVADRAGPLEDADTFGKHTAGAETNVAIGLSRLGVKVGWASRVGADSMGRYLIRAMEKEGIDCSHVVADSTQRTGIQVKGRVEGGGDPPSEYYRKGSAASLFQPEQIDVPWLVSARHLHTTGVFSAVSESCLATVRQSMTHMREAGRTVSFDTNLRPALWSSKEYMREVINELAGMADWVLPGIEEGRILTGEKSAEGIAAFYRANGAKLVVVKLGPEGAFFNGEGGCGHIPGFAVSKVVDTVGAGDGFAAGVISGLLDGHGVPDAVKRGAWIGARAVQVVGDSEGFPTYAELVEADLKH